MTDERPATTRRRTRPRNPLLLMQSPFLCQAASRIARPGDDHVRRRRRHPRGRRHNLRCRRRRDLAASGPPDAQDPSLVRRLRSLLRRVRRGICDLAAVWPQHPERAAHPRGCVRPALRRDHARDHPDPARRALAAAELERLRLRCDARTRGSGPAERCFAWKAAVDGEILRARCRRRTSRSCGPSTRR